MQGRLVELNSVGPFAGAKGGLVKRKETKMNDNVHDPHNEEPGTQKILCLAMELSNAKWLLTFGEGSTRRRKVEVKGGDRYALLG